MNELHLITFYTNIEVDEEKKVHAVRDFYANVLGDFNAVQRLQLISKHQKCFQR